LPSTFALVSGASLRFIVGAIFSAGPFCGEPCAFWVVGALCAAGVCARAQPLAVINAMAEAETNKVFLTVFLLKYAPEIQLDVSGVRSVVGRFIA
jgi:hypothetical protein